VVKEESSEEKCHRIRLLEEEVKRLNLEVAKWQQSRDDDFANLLVEPSADECNRELEVLRGLLH